MQAPAGLDNYDLKYKLRPATENCQTKGFELVEPETLTIANSVYDGFGPVLLGVSGIMTMKCMVLNHDNASGEGLKDMLEKLKGYLRSVH